MYKTIIALSTVLILAVTLIVLRRNRLPVCSSCQSARQCASRTAWGETPESLKCGTLEEQMERGCFERNRLVCWRCNWDGQCASTKCYNKKCGFISDQIEAGCHEKLLPVCSPCQRNRQCLSGKCWGNAREGRMCVTGLEQLEGGCSIRPSSTPDIYDIEPSPSPDIYVIEPSASPDIYL